MLETERCVLRRLELSDAPALHEVLSDGRVMRYIEPPFDPERTERFIKTAGDSDPPAVYALVLRETGRLIGHVIFHPFDESAWETGWVLAEEYWGRGIASEVTAALVEKARELSIPELAIECAPEQTATVRIAEKYGFALSGTGNGLLVFRKKI